MYSLSAGLLLKDICHQDAKTEIIFSRKDSKLKSQKQLEYEVEKMRLGSLDQHPRIHGDFILNAGIHKPLWPLGGKSRRAGGLKRWLMQIKRTI